MKPLTLVCLLICLAGLTSPVPAETKKPDATKTGNTTVVVYEGPQNWPTDNSAQIIKDYSVPIYLGLPNKSYRVLGRVVDERTSGFDEIGRAFDDAFGGQKQRIRDCANQAKLHGGNAVLVTDDDRVLNALKLSTKEAKDTSPLAHEKRKVVLIIKI